MAIIEPIPSSFIVPDWRSSDTYAKNSVANDWLFGFGRSPRSTAPPPNIVDAPAFVRIEYLNDIMFHFVMVQ